MNVGGLKINKTTPVLQLQTLSRLDTGRRHVDRLHYLADTETSTNIDRWKPTRDTDWAAQMSSPIKLTWQDLILWLLFEHLRV